MFGYIFIILITWYAKNCTQDLQGQRKGKIGVCIRTSVIQQFCTLFIFTTSRGRSVSIVSDYGLDDRVIGVRFPADAAEFSSSLCARPALGPTQPPILWVPRALTPGVKRGQDVTLTTHPHLVPWRMSSSRISSPPNAYMARSETALLYMYYYNIFQQNIHQSAVCAESVTLICCSVAYASFSVISSISCGSIFLIHLTYPNY
jgi:hypothetical protein